MITRIQRSRRKGFRLPPRTLCIGRGGWCGNPFFEEDQPGETPELRRAQAVMSFRLWCGSDPVGITFMDRLGQELSRTSYYHIACWCGVDEQCHGDVILEIMSNPKHAWPFPRVNGGRLFVIPTIGGYRAIVGETIQVGVPGKHKPVMTAAGMCGGLGSLAISGTGILGTYPTPREAMAAGMASQGLIKEASELRRLRMQSARVMNQSAPSGAA